MHSSCTSNGKVKPMKYNVGLYGGSFDPFHQGHLNNIIQAAGECETLYIMISYSRQRDSVPMEIRYRWILACTKHLNNVEIIPIEDVVTTKQHYDRECWEQGARDIKQAIGRPIDIVYCGTGYEDSQIFETLYPESEVKYFDRTFIPISSSQMRKDIYTYWNFLPQPCRSYYCKKVLIVGTESTGKSTLTENLANFYNTNFVHEVGRDRCEEAGKEEFMNFDDLAYNMICQKREELEAIKTSNKLLFIDTDAIITLFYAFLLLEPQEAERLERLAMGITEIMDFDLIIFLEPVKKPIQDGTRNEEILNDQEKYSLDLKSLLGNYDMPIFEIDGEYDERYRKVIDIITEQLNIQPYYNENVNSFDFENFKESLFNE